MLPTSNVASEIRFEAKQVAVIPLERFRRDPSPSIGVHRDFGQKEIVCWEGDPADTVFQVAKGVVRLDKTTADGRRQVVGFVYPGSWFGLAAGRDYAFTAETITRCNLRACARREVERRVREDSDFAAFMLDIAGKAIASAHDQMVVLGQKSALARVSSFLLHLRDHQNVGDVWNRFDLPMDRTDIADYLGLTIETVCRKLTELKRRNVIAMPSTKDVVIQNTTLLSTLADGEMAGLQ